MGGKRAVVVSLDPTSDVGGWECMCHQAAGILERLGFDRPVGMARGPPARSSPRPTKFRR